MHSPLAYIGGKSRLAQKIIDNFPAHDSYCEVFAGGAWVLFSRSPAKYETINDFDSDLICFYRVVQNHLEEFLKQFKWILVSRQWFEDWKRQQTAGGLTDIQRAARYYYLQRLCFGGRVRNRTFGATPMDRPRINLLRLEEDLSEIHLRLARVTIENLSWDTFLDKYDRHQTFFYLDPPYYLAPVYQHNFQLVDFERLASRLSDLKGRFLLSLGDHADMRRIFAPFHIEPVSLTYSVNKKSATVGKELLISNFKV